MSSDRIKVAFFYTGGNSPSGPSSWLTRLLPRLISFNIDPVAIRYASELHETTPTAVLLNRSGINVRSIDGSGLTLAEGVKEALHAMAKENPDVIVADHVLPAMLATFWSRRANKPTVMILRSDDAYYWRLADEFLWGRPEYRLHGVVAVSKELMDRVVAGTSSEMMKMQCPSSVPIPSGSASWNGHDFHLVYVGRFDEKQKRIMALTERLIEISQTRPWFRATLFGDGTELENVVDLINSKSSHQVKYGGHLQVTDVYPVLLSAQAMVLFSAFEGLSTAVQESMACGLPVIIKKMKSGFKDVIVHEKTAWVLRNDRELSNAVDTLAGSHRYWQRLSINSKNLAQKVFSIDTAAKRWTDFLYNLHHQSAGGLIPSPTATEIEKTITHHSQYIAARIADKVTLDDYYAQLLVCYSQTWTSALHEYFIDAENPLESRRWLLGKAIDRKLLNGQELEQLLYDRHFESSLKNWLLRYAASKGRFSDSLLQYILHDRRFSWDTRRWLLYRLIEKSEVGGKTLNRVANDLAQEGLKMVIQEPTHDYNCASLLELGTCWSQATSIFKRLIKEQNGNKIVAGSLFHLGCIAKKTGEGEKSDYYLNACLSVCPEHRAAAKALESNNTTDECKQQ